MIRSKESNQSLLILIQKYNINNKVYYIIQDFASSLKLQLR